MARRVFSVLQLISFWEPLTSKTKARAGTPSQTQNPNKPLLQSPPGTDALQQREQTPSARGKAKPISANSCASSPSENKAPRSRVWARRQPCPQPFALAQEDETMQANVKHHSTAGKLLSRLIWPLDLQAQSSALPVQGFLGIPTVSWGLSAFIPQIRGRPKALATVPNAFVIASCLGWGRSLPHMLMQRPAPTRELLITTAIRRINASVPRKIQISLTAQHSTAPRPAF